jgi:hypothetical protein
MFQHHLKIGLRLLDKLVITPLLNTWNTSSLLKKTTLLIPSAVVALGYTICRFRLFPHKSFYQAWFSGTLVGCFATAVGVAAFPAHILSKIGIISKRSAEIIAMNSMNIGCKLIILLNPQLRLHFNYRNANWGEVSKHAVFMANHNSWFDAVFYTGLVPLDLYKYHKGFMKGALRNIPIAGYVFFEVLGQFPVHYNSEERENFAVDKEKQAQEMQKVLDWIRVEKNSFVYSPEGRVNPDPDKIQELRYGMIKVLFEEANDCSPFYLLTFWNAADFWGQTEKTGGKPCDMLVRMSKYYLPTHASHPEIVDENGKLKDVTAFAAHMRSFMQQEVDEAKAEYQSSGFKKW